MRLESIAIISVEVVEKINMPARKTKLSKIKTRSRTSGRKCNVKIEVEESESSVIGNVQTSEMDCERHGELDREDSIDEETMEALLGSLQQLNSRKDGATSSELGNLAPQTAPTQPYVEITEQPKQRDHRFRYPVEGRQAGSIMGEKASPAMPSYPSLKVHNMTSRAKVVVSLVTKDEPPRPHPHRLVGDNCNDGVCTMIINPRQPEAIFRKIGVQRTMNKEVENSLAERQRAGVRLPMEVSKGKTGKKHNYDMKSVRLFYEVSLETQESSGIFNQHLPTVVSSPIYDKKDTVLTICRVNIRSGTVAGGDELFILCEKVQSEDIKVLFSGTDPATQQPWSEYGIFGQSDVHRQYAIVCKTPKFVNQQIKAAVTVNFKLYRPSDEESSNEMEFTYKPLDTTYGRDNLEKKKRKFNHKGDESYNRFFTSQGKPLKTETLGASAQSCSGAPVSNPVSNAPATLTCTPTTTSEVHVASPSSMVKENLRQRIMKNKDSSPRPSTPVIGGTAQPTDSQTQSPVVATYASEAIMSTGHLLQQQQPVSNDQGHFGLLDLYENSVATTMLLSQATNQVQPSPLGAVGGAATMEEGDQDERQSSEQIIQALADSLRSQVEGAVGEQPQVGVALGGVATTVGTTLVSETNNVIVEQMPSSEGLEDFRISLDRFDTLDVAALQDVISTQHFDLVFTHREETDMDISNNHGSSGNPS